MLISATRCLLCSPEVPLLKNTFSTALPLQIIWLDLKKEIGKNGISDITLGSLPFKINVAYAAYIGLLSIW